MDDLVFRKVNESDASAFSRLCPAIPSRVWGVIWCVCTTSAPASMALMPARAGRLFISVIFLACGILAGLAAFKETAEEQKEAAKRGSPTPACLRTIADSRTDATDFLPTRMLF